MLIMRLAVFSRWTKTSREVVYNPDQKKVLTFLLPLPCGADGVYQRDLFVRGK